MRRKSADIALRMQIRPRLYGRLRSFGKKNPGIHGGSRDAGRRDDAAYACFPRIITFARKKNSTSKKMAADIIAELSQNACHVGK